MKTTKNSSKKAASKMTVSSAISKVLGQKKSGASFTRDSLTSSVNKLVSASDETIMRTLRRDFSERYSYSRDEDKYSKR
jgi:hypothetical protein